MYLQNKLEGKKMPITELLERNARDYANDIALVEVNTAITEVRRVTWREYELMEPNPKAPYRREITWSVFNEKANRFAGKAKLKFKINEFSRQVHWLCLLTSDTILQR